MAENAGGFFASLKLMTDEGSFTRGVGHVKSLADKLAGLVAWGAGLAGVALGLKGVINAAAEHGKIAITAEKLNMTTKNLEAWRTVIHQAGGDANGFTSSLEALHNKLVDLDKGIDPGGMFAQNLERGLKLNMGAILKMSPEQAMRTIMEAGEERIRNTRSRKDVKGEDLAKSAVEQLAGSDALNRVLWDVRLNKSLGGSLGRAGASVYTNERTTTKSFEGLGELNLLTDKLKSAFAALSEEVMKNLLPYLKRLNIYLETHQKEIKDFIESVGKAAEAIAKWAEGILKDAVKSKSAVDFVDKRLERGQWADPQMKKIVDEYRLRKEHTAFEDFVFKWTTNNPAFRTMGNLGYALSQTFSDALGIPREWRVTVEDATKGGIEAEVKPSPPPSPNSQMLQGAGGS